MLDMPDCCEPLDMSEVTIEISETCLCECLCRCTKGSQVTVSPLGLGPTLIGLGVDLGEDD